MSYNYHENYHENLTLGPIIIETKTKKINSIPNSENSNSDYSQRFLQNSNNPENKLPPIENLPTEKKIQSLIDERYLSALTNKQIFERVFKNSSIANSSMIFDYLSLKKENVENRVFNDNSKAWDWKFDYKTNQYALPDSGLIYYIKYF